jgi:hypothetical protein
MDFKKKVSKLNYLELLAQIKSRAAASSAIRQAAGKNSGLTRAKLRNMKRKMKAETRIYLWCLAILKGRKLIDIEPKSDESNRPSREVISRKLSLYYEWSAEAQADKTESIANFFGDPAKEKAA